VPVEGVVPHLSGVIENSTVRTAHDLFQRFAFIIGTLDQVVQIGDVGLMMFVVMVFQGFH